MKKGILILLTIIAIIICKDIPGVLYVMVDADTYELETYNSNYALETNTNHWANTNLDYNEILGMKVIHFNNANNQVQLSSSTTYIKWNLRFKSKPETGNYNISGAIRIGNIGQFITGANLSNSNSICTIEEYSQNTSYINFKCENAHIDNQYFSIIFYLGINQTNGYLGNPDISRYLNMERTQQDIMTQDHTYNNNASENIEGQDELNDLQDAESDLMNSLDFSGAEDLDITINPNASNYIWEIVNRLRQMNPSIIVLMTSVLGLGIIKLILNR